MPVPQTERNLQQLLRLDSLDPFVWAYEFQVPTDPPTRYRFVSNYDQQIEFRGNLYYPFPITHSGQAEDTEANILDVLEPELRF